MTPTEQDKELREKLLNLRITVWKQTNLNGQANLDHDSVNEILQLITADRERVAIEARIDELENNKWLPNEAKWIEQEADRIAELKAQQEEKHGRNG